MTFTLLFQTLSQKDSLMLKRTRAFMQRNSSWVTFSMQNLWESSFILTQCSYILDTCIRLLRGGKKSSLRRGRRSTVHNKRWHEKPREGQAERTTGRWETINSGRRKSQRKKKLSWEKKWVGWIMEKENDREAEKNESRRIHYHAGQKQPDRVTEVSCRQNEYFTKCRMKHQSPDGLWLPLAF